MSPLLWGVHFRWRYIWRILPWFLLLGTLTFIRWTKGTGYADFYSLISRPFWPGPSQKEWIQSGFRFEQESKLKLLEKDNYRLRELLDLQKSLSKNRISAAVIARTTSGWWQQLEINKGGLDGISVGDAVLGPGGLLGRVHSITPTTSRIKLLTDQSSRIGVWVPRIKKHGLLIGIGTNRPRMIFLDQDSKAISGDIITTSPASTILPPNILVGIINSLDIHSLPEPRAYIQLTASPQAIDWVIVQKF